MNSDLNIVNGLVIITTVWGAAVVNGVSFNCVARNAFFCFLDRWLDVPLFPLAYEMFVLSVRPIDRWQYVFVVTRNAGTLDRCQCVSAVTGNVCFVC